MGQAPCRRPPKVDSGESILETGTSWLENSDSETRFGVFGRSGEALGRSLGGFWCLGGVLEALGRSLDRFLEALGRIWESKLNEFCFKIKHVRRICSEFGIVF